MCDDASFSILWSNDSLNLTEIAWHARLSIETVRKRARVLGLPSRAKSQSRWQPEHISEDEIARRIAEVQARWTPADEEARRVGPSRAWSLPVAHFDLP